MAATKILRSIAVLALVQSTAGGTCYKSYYAGNEPAVQSTTWPPTEECSNDGVGKRMYAEMGNPGAAGCLETCDDDEPNCQSFYVSTENPDAAGAIQTWNGAVKHFARSGCTDKVVKDVDCDCMGYDGDDCTGYGQEVVCTGDNCATAVYTCATCGATVTCVGAGAPPPPGSAGAATQGPIMMFAAAVVMALASAL